MTEEDEALMIDNYNGVQKCNFIFHYVIGKGGFGKVWKVELKKNRHFYAMKEMSKAKYEYIFKQQSDIQEKCEFSDE